MAEVFSQAKKFDVGSIIDSSKVVFSKEIVIERNPGLLEISEICSENYSISGRNIVEMLEEKFQFEKRINLSSELEKILEENILRDKDFSNDFKNGEIIIGFKDHVYGFSSIGYFYFDRKKGWVKNDYLYELGHIGVLYVATLSTSIY